MMQAICPLGRSLVAAVALLLLQADRAGAAHVQFVLPGEFTSSIVFGDLTRLAREEIQPPIDEPFLYPEPSGELLSCACIATVAGPRRRHARSIAA